MEYAKDIVVDLKKGQAGKKRNNSVKVFLRKIGRSISNHKIMTTIVTTTISFIVLDVLLISSFIGILGKI